jgi:hypothetical protein
VDGSVGVDDEHRLVRTHLDRRDHNATIGKGDRLPDAAKDV